MFSQFYSLFRQEVDQRLIYIYTKIYVCVCLHACVCVCVGVTSNIKSVEHSLNSN